MNDSIRTLVTIIIPVYNSELYLIKCLDSAIQQTYQHLEIILINDGSTDKSPKIIDEYAARDSRIVAIHKANGGIGSAYNAAFEAMTGDYVLFVDSDDWLELNAVENLVKLALNNEADLVSFSIKAYNTTGNEVNLPSFKNIDLINSTNEAILKTHFEVLKHPTLVRLYKSELFNEIVVFEQNIGIDEMLTPQLLAKCNRAVYTSEVYYNVLIRQDSVCRSPYTKKKIEQTFRVYDFLLDYTSVYLKKYAHIFLAKYYQVLIGIYRDTLMLSEHYEKTLIYGLKVRIKDLKLELKQTDKKIKHFNRLYIINKLLLNFPLVATHKIKFKAISKKYIGKFSSLFND